MKAYLSSRPAATGIAFGVVAALSFSGVAQAITDTVFKYSTLKTGYYSIDQMAMSPSDHAAANVYTNSWGNGLSVGSTTGCFNAGVNLPNGATITAINFWYFSGPPGNPTGYLYRHNLADGTQNIIASRTFADDSFERKQGAMAVVPAFAVVNNGLYSYSFGTCVGPSTAFHAARIKYTYGHAGD